MVIRQESKRTETTAPAGSDWVAFEQSSSTFSSTERKSGSARSSSRSRASSKWMQQPISTDATWTPIAAPSIANSPTLHVASGGDRGVSAFTLQPVNAKTNSSLVGKEDRALPRQVQVKKKKKPVSIPPPPDRPRRSVERTTTTSTTSAESSGSSFRPQQQRDSSRGRSVSSTRDNSATRSASRGRSKSRSRPDSGTGAANHDEKRERSSSRQRSISGSSSDHQQSSSSHHSSSSSKQQQPLENQPREKSRGRSRPPVTRNGRDAARSHQQTHRSSSANTRDRSRPRARSRSASLTRVTSPHQHVIQPSISPIPVAGISLNNGGDHAGSSAGVRHLPPPTTHRTRDRTREETRKSSSGGGGNNNNNNNNNSSSRSSRLNTEDRSLDINIGRDITFGPPKTSPSSVSSSNRKKTGLLGKLFGDQVDRNKTKTFKDEIRPRILLAATVYHNTATNLWITTINTNQRGVAKNPTLANKYLKAFSFSTEHEARESAIANAPPKMVPFSESPSCFVCKGNFAVFRRASHCRNCGVCVCKDCTAQWPAKMIPDTYNLKNEAHVRVCRSCFGLSNSFKAALMDGDYEQAIALYGTGNVNLRTPFPVTNKKDEIMYPVHCAIEGGNIHIVRWLIDDHYCPIKMIRPGSKKARRGTPECLISTSKSRHVLSIAIQRLKVDIIRYLVVDCGISIHESTDLEGSLRALEATLLCLPASADRRYPDESVEPRWDNASFDDISEPSTLGVGSDRGLLDNDLDTVGSKSNRTKNASESCIICCDRKIDCVATPCGHQVCCLECSSNLASCPVCNNRGEFIRIFKP